LPSITRANGQLDTRCR